MVIKKNPREQEQQAADAPAQERRAQAEQGGVGMILFEAW